MRVLVLGAAILSSGAISACGEGSGVGPDPIAPQFYDLRFVDNSSLPQVMFIKAFGGTISLKSATLVPYAVGRTIDQRLLNDRTGRGASGGNTRDTTVARGQMMDIRVWIEAGGFGSVVTRDSTLVDVEVRDTSFIIKRPSPNKDLFFVDTGYFVDNLLLVPTKLDYRVQFGVNSVKPVLLSYQITR